MSFTAHQSLVVDSISNWEPVLHQAIALIRAMSFRPDDREALSKKIFPCIDLTSLNEDDTPHSITELSKKAVQGSYHVAAVCVYPQFLSQLLFLRSHGVHLATVVNFPKGEKNLAQIGEEIQYALAQGAEEIDIVFPYRAFFAGHNEEVLQFLKFCRASTENVILKIILETGAFSDIKDIYRAAILCYEAKADFTKTSTGKIPQGASLESVGALFFAAQHCQSKYNKPFGVKISGGVRTFEQAATYLVLARELIGDDLIHPETFRIGASQLIDSLSLRLTP